MKVSVQLFAVARDKAGRANLEIELAEQATVADLKSALTKECPALAPLLAASRIAVGSEYAGDHQLIAKDAEIALIPPVSGG